MRSITKKTVLFAALTILTLGCYMELPDKNTPNGRLYIEKCGICHEPMHPSMLSIKGWTNMITKMEKKLKNTPVREPLTEEEKTRILEYLNSHARARAF